MARCCSAGRRSTQTELATGGSQCLADGVVKPEDDATGHVRSRSRASAPAGSWAAIRCHGARPAVLKNGIAGASLATRRGTAAVVEEVERRVGQGAPSDARGRGGRMCCRAGALAARRLLLPEVRACRQRRGQLRGKERGLRQGPREVIRQVASVGEGAHGSSAAHGRAFTFH